MFERQTSDFWKAKRRSFLDDIAESRSATVKQPEGADAKESSQEGFLSESLQSRPSRNTVTEIQQPELKSSLQRTEHRTIHLDEEVAGIIAEQARQEHTTDIQVMQRAVDRYARWHLWEEKFGFISVPSSMERKLMSLLTETQARELGRHLAETFAQDFVRYVFKTPSLANVLAAFRYLARPYANFFSLQEYNSEDHTLLFFHDRGVKVSILWEEIISYALRKIAPRRSSDQTHGESDQCSLLDSKVALHGICQ